MVGPQDGSWTDRFLYELVLPGFEPCRFNCPPGSRRQDTGGSSADYQPRLRTDTLYGRTGRYPPGDFEQIGATSYGNACGPCIGQWKRHTDDNTRKNSIVTSFNRNFAKRADGNPNTHAFVASPELTLALTIAGDLCFNPLTDTLKTADGREVKLKEPEGTDFPPKGSK